MKEIETQIEINTNAEKVWATLVGFKNYPGWNPFIKSVEGNAVVGETISITIQPIEGKQMSFKPKILVRDVNEELRWKGKLGIGGLFDGEHYFKIIEQEENLCLFVHGELFSGLLIPFMGKTLANAAKGFELMNEALKERCEESV